MPTGEAMAENCVNHTFDLAHARCRDCGHTYCTSCLVYAFGPAKPPMCVKCAIVAAGVRTNAAPRPVRSKKETRRLHKDQVKASKLAARMQGGKGGALRQGMAAGTGVGPDGGSGQGGGDPDGGVIPAPADTGVHRLAARFRPGPG